MLVYQGLGIQRWICKYLAHHGRHLGNFVEFYLIYPTIMQEWASLDHPKNGGHIKHKVND